MNSPERQATPSDRLIVGFCGVPVELMIAISLCRHFDGQVLFRERDVMVIEFGADPAVIDELLGKLPRAAVTHVWRSALPRTSRIEAAAAPVNFCSI